jgi:hypothetical protein
MFRQEAPSELIQVFSVAGGQVEERGLAAEIARKTQAEADIVRPPGFFHRLDREHPLAGRVDQGVIHMLEIAGAVDAPHVLVQHLLVDRLAHGGFHVGNDGFRVDPLQRFDPDLVDLSDPGAWATV